MLHYTLKSSSGHAYIETYLKGKNLMRAPLLNKETAFTKEERLELGLLGKLPYRQESIDEQMARAYLQYSSFSEEIDKQIYLNQLHDRNEILFYRLLDANLEEMLPIIYTPCVGEAVRAFSRKYIQPRGLFVSYPDQEWIEQILNNRTHPQIDLITVTDGQRILGIGDQGVGGIEIPVAKQTIYSLSGLNPYKVLPIMLDVGTDNKEQLDDPFYLGWRHPRLQGEKYEEFIDIFVKKTQKLFPNILLHFEDFGKENARKILEKYQDKLCAFNDDIQGTAVVTLAAILSAIGYKKESLQQQRFLIFGAGTAGVGIADQLCELLVLEGIPFVEARKLFWLVDQAGLLFENSPNLLSFQKPYARPRGSLENLDHHDLQSIISFVRPTVLIGASAVANAFQKEAILEMAQYIEHPIILPLSNPLSCAEAAPSDLVDWTKGKALIAYGSPIRPFKYRGQTVSISQCNNALAFPGIGLGILACKASRLSKGMLLEAAKGIMEMHAKTPSASKETKLLLPKLGKLRETAFIVACKIIEQARKEGFSQASESLSPEELIQSVLWKPVYLPIKNVK